MADEPKDEREVAAVWIATDLVAGDLNRLTRIALKQFGLKPGEGHPLNFCGDVDGGYFVRRSPNDPTYHWPKDHPLHHQPRYDWTDVDGRDGKVKVGRLQPEPQEED